MTVLVVALNRDGRERERGMKVQVTWKPRPVVGWTRVECVWTRLRAVERVEQGLAWRGVRVDVVNARGIDTWRIGREGGRACLAALSRETG